MGDSNYELSEHLNLQETPSARNQVGETPSGRNSKSEKLQVRETPTPSAKNSKLEKLQV